MQERDFVEDFIREVRYDLASLSSSSLLDLVAFKEEAEGDQHSAFRSSVLTVLSESFTFDDRTFIRFLLEQEIMYHSWTHGFSHSIKLCAFLLFTLAQVEDIELLWEAKGVSFDTVLGLEDQLLVGAGIPATIVYLQQIHEDWAENASEYIKEGYPFSDDDLKKYRRDTQRLFQEKVFLFNTKWSQ